MIAGDMDAPAERGPVVLIAREFAKHLIGRDIGLAIRRRHFAGAPDSWPALDFGGVEQATESCIDELFGELARRHGLAAVRQIPVSGASKPVRETLAYVFEILGNPPKAPDAAALLRLIRSNKPAVEPRRARSKSHRSKVSGVVPGTRRRRSA